jgi:hypothetical protein
VRLLLAVVFALLVLAGTAQAQDRIGTAAESLRQDPVYVDPEAERAISERQADDLRQEIVSEDAGPLYVAILPAVAANEAGGDPEAALRELAETVGEPGTYAALIGDAFRAGATQGVLPSGEAGELASQAFEAEGGNGVAAVLEDFVRRVGDARAGEQSGSEGSEGGGFPVGLLFLLLLAVPLVVLAVSRQRRRRREQAAEFADVREVARDDVVALGDDIRSLDIDMEMADVDPEAKQHYGLAVERYTQASEALDLARRPEDLKHVTEQVEEGRWAMEAAKAEMAGQPAPERRPPCFFDPRHGPSVTDVEWAPPYGEPRQVPACAADAIRIQEGEEPHAREVTVHGERVPYWQAGPALAPWAGGFYGSGLLPGLFVGSLLGGGFGVPGDAYASDPGDFGDVGDFGGGDFGGGFGGGDFGGGDF